MGTINIEIAVCQFPAHSVTVVLGPARTRARPCRFFRNYEGKEEMQMASLPSQCFRQIHFCFRHLDHLFLFTRKDNVSCRSFVLKLEQDNMLNISYRKFYLAVDWMVPVRSVDARGRAPDARCGRHGARRHGHGASVRVRFVLTGVVLR